MEREQIVASNLARFRAERGLTQRELAESASISRITLGQVERGEVDPRKRTLERIASALKVSISDLTTAAGTLSGVRFRAATRVNSREQILAEVARWLDVYSDLESILGRHREFRLSSLIGTDSNPISMAAKARRNLGLDGEEPIHDICGLLEDAGVKVLLLKKATDSFFGLSVSCQGGGPAIVINTWDRISVERWIFTAAHELGHILLHSDTFVRDRDEEEVDDEREADQFAAHLLLPRGGFDLEWQEARGHSLLDRVLKVKRIFRVSYKTVLNRLVENGEPPSLWGKFQGMHRTRFGSTLKRRDETHPVSDTESGFRWNRSGEPDGLSTYDFVHDRLARLVRLAREREAITGERAASILGISMLEMESLEAEWEN